jgi:hypothetical protein
MGGNIHGNIHKEHEGSGMLLLLRWRWSLASFCSINIPSMLFIGFR